MLQTMPFMAIAGNPAVKPGNGPSQDRECRNDVRSSHRAKETPFSETLKDASHNVCENEQNNETAMTERKDSVSRRSGEAGSEKAAAKEADVKDTDVKEVRHPEADELMQLLEMLRELESEAGWNAIAAEGGNQIGLAGGGLSRSEFVSLTGLLQDLSSMNNLDPGQLKKLLGNFLKVLEAAGEVSPGMNDLKLLIQNQLNPETGLPREVFLTQLAAKVRQLAGIAGDASGQNRELSSGSKETQPANAQKPAEPGGGQAKTAVSGSGDAGRPGSPTVTGENETGGMVKTNTAADVSAKANGAPAMPDSGSGSEAGRRLLEKASASDVVMKTASENQTSAPENARPVGNSEPQAAGPRIEQLQAQVGTQHQYSGNGSADGGSTPGQVSPATYTTQTYQGDRAVFTQIIQKVKLAAAPGTSEMQIELKPEFLGRLKLTVSTENGLVTARFNTHSPQVKAVIEANLAALRDSLADQGIKVDQLSVTVTPEKNHSGQGERDGLFKRRNQARGSRLPLNEDQLETVFSAGARRLTSAGYYGNTVDFTA